MEVHGHIYNITQREDFFLVLEAEERRRVATFCLGVAGSDFFFFFSSSEESSFTFFLDSFSSSLELLEEVSSSSSVNKYINVRVLQTVSAEFPSNISKSRPDFYSVYEYQKQVVPIVVQMAAGQEIASTSARNGQICTMVIVTS